MKKILAKLRIDTRVLFVALCVVLGVIAAVGYTAVSPKTYTATTMLFIGSPASGDSAGAYQGDLFSQQRAATYAQLFAGDDLAVKVNDDLSLGLTPSELAAKVTATSIEKTVLLQVDVTDSTATGASDIANAYATNFAQYVGQLETPEGKGQPSTLVSIVTKAEPPAAPTSPSSTINLAGGVFLGLVVGLLVLYLRRRFDTSVRTPAAAVAAAGAPVLGSLPADTERDRALLHLPAEAGSAYAEQVRKLRTTVQFIDPDKPVKSIMVSAADTRGGADAVAAHLALMLGEVGRTVALVDADLRHSRLAAYVGAPPTTLGLADVLSGEVMIEEATVAVADGRVDLVPAGASGENPAEDIASDLMRNVIAELARTHDYVIVSAPAATEFADAAVLGAAVDGVALVVRRGATDAAEVTESADTMRSIGATVLGTVLVGGRATAKRTTRPAPVALPVEIPADPKPARVVTEKVEAAPEVDAPDRVDRLDDGYTLDRRGDTFDPHDDFDHQGGYSPRRQSARSDYEHNGYGASQFVQGDAKRRDLQSPAYSGNGYDDERRYDQRGFDERGYDERGYDERGYDERGFNRDGYNDRGYNEQGYFDRGNDRQTYAAQDRDNYFPETAYGQRFVAPRAEWVVRDDTSPYVPQPEYGAYTEYDDQNPAAAQAQWPSRSDVDDDVDSGRRIGTWPPEDGTSTRRYDDAVVSDDHQTASAEFIDHVAAEPVLDEPTADEGVDNDDSSEHFDWAPAAPIRRVAREIVAADIDDDVPVADEVPLDRPALESAVADRTETAGADDTADADVEAVADEAEDADLSDEVVAEVDDSQTAEVDDDTADSEPDVPEADAVEDDAVVDEAVEDEAVEDEAVEDEAAEDESVDAAEEPAADVVVAGAERELDSANDSAEADEGIVDEPVAEDEVDEKADATESSEPNADDDSDDDSEGTASEKSDKAESDNAESDNAESDKAESEATTSAPAKNSRPATRPAADNGSPSDDAKNGSGTKRNGSNSFVASGRLNGRAH